LSNYAANYMFRYGYNFEYLNESLSYIRWLFNTVNGKVTKEICYLYALYYVTP